jgi:hypothetical protein
MIRASIKQLHPKNMSNQQDKQPLCQAMNNELRDMPMNVRVKDGMHFTRLCCAAEIRGLADWLVPEEIEPPSPEGEPWPQSYQLMSDSKWEQRQMIRQYLLDEANKAEMGL